MMRNTQSRLACNDLFGIRRARKRSILGTDELSVFLPERHNADNDLEKYPLGVRGGFDQLRP